MDTSFGPLTHLGRYKIVRQIGRGSMGVVYEGLDPRLNRPVAIKTILKGHLADEDMAADYALRFQREAQAVGRLTHPHIVTLYDFGDEQEVTYIVMEFIRGRELASHFEAGEYFDLPQSVRIMGELLDALAYAHEHGIVHRDIKPANVMLDEEGHVKLTDFGVARVTDANTDRTQPGTMVGTPSYMSPEQILGMAVGSRADLFAAGVVLYQFLTHDKPFKGNGPWDVQRKIVSDQQTPPSRLNPALPRAFDAVVAKALAKKPEHRYANANAFAADLRLALDSASPTVSSTVSPTFSQFAAPVARQANSKLAAHTAPQAVQSMAATVDLPLDLDATEAQAPTPALATAPGEPTAPGERRRLRWLAAVALLLASLVGAGWFWRPGQDAQSENPAPRPAACWSLRLAVIHRLCPVSSCCSSQKPGWAPIRITMLS